MNNQNLYDHSDAIAHNLSDYMRKNGHTKISLCKKAGISRPTLDKILSGKIESKTMFNKHMGKILSALNLCVDDILNYSFPYAKEVHAVYSKNAPKEYTVNENVKEQYEILQDVLNICAIYYPEIILWVIV